MSQRNHVFSPATIRIQRMRTDSSNRERKLNLVDYVPKYVWREVYRGRWLELRGIQKTEFIVEVGFFVLLGGAIIRAYHVNSNLIGLLLTFGAVWLVLGIFFLLLTRFIR
jgi:hypothetical protein